MNAIVSLCLTTVLAVPALAEEPLFVPAIDGDWWQVAGNPDLGELTAPDQEPVDFAVWQAADGTWQLQSCIRKTKEPGRGRLFHRWEGGRLTDRDWKPIGIAMRAEPALGETLGGLQAPFVFRVGDAFQMFFGDSQNIARARSADGKTFERQPQRGISGLFGDGPQANTRDPMLLDIGGTWHAYYTASLYTGSERRVGAIFSRTSHDLNRWSAPTLVAIGGQAGHDGGAMECPFVVKVDDWYYLFTTQLYRNPSTNVYRSKDPLYFAIEDDAGLVATLPVAAPEIFEHEGRFYVAALMPNLDGTRIAPLAWKEKGS
ncbi:MAG TPA: hypothetical protein VHR17_04825 [Thermoanaerobaculia bacterium]|nr:hypothetical protein [Thermoanaerobaculia bacterium]